MVKLCILLLSPLLLMIYSSGIYARDDVKLSLKHLEIEPIFVRATIQFQADLEGMKCRPLLPPTVTARGCSLRNWVVSPDNKHCVFDLDAPMKPKQLSGDLVISFAGCAKDQRRQVFASPLRYYEQGGLTIGNQTLANSAMHLVGGTSMDFIPPVRPAISRPIGAFAHSTSFSGVPLGKRIGLWYITPSKNTGVRFVKAKCDFGNVELVYNYLSTIGMIHVRYEPWNKSGGMKAGVHKLMMYFEDAADPKRGFTNITDITVSVDGTARVVKPTGLFPSTDDIPNYESPRRWVKASVRHVNVPGQ